MLSQSADPLGTLRMLDPVPTPADVAFDLSVHDVLNGVGAITTLAELQSGRFTLTIERFDDFDDNGEPYTESTDVLIKSDDLDGGSLTIPEHLVLDVTVALARIAGVHERLMRARNRDLRRDESEIRAAAEIREGL